jgi:uncharacterized membrane protein YcaP (DUF421 family)
MLHVFVSVAKRRWPSLGRVAEGTPTIVYANGQWDERRLREMRIYKGDVLAEMRQRGISHLDDVKYAIVENHGGISIMATDTR